MTQSDLNQKLSDIRKENSDLGEKIKALEISSSMMTTKKEQDDADAQLELMKSHWRKRKAIFRGIWDIICESMEGSPKDLLVRKLLRIVLITDTVPNDAVL